MFHLHISDGNKLLILFLLERAPEGFVITRLNCCSESKATLYTLHSSVTWFHHSRSNCYTVFLKCLWIGEPISTPSTFLTVFLWSVFVLVCVLSQMKKLQKRERTCRAYMKVYLCYATMLYTCFCTFSSSFPAIVSQHGPVSFHSHCRHSISLRLCPQSRRFNISVDWKLCGCNFYAQFIPFMCLLMVCFFQFLYC